MTPLGELIAAPERGLVYGNRGCLHDEHGEIRRSYATKRWIACRLQFRGRRRTPLMAPGRFTELFFLDEATALAAGHRACAECRRGDYNRLAEVWAEIHPDQVGADAIDAQLHTERRDSRLKTRRLHEALFKELPDGAVVLHRNSICLVLGARLLRWSPGGYGDPSRRPTNDIAHLVTPPSLLELLRRGWSPLVPLLHPSAEHASS